MITILPRPSLLKLAVFLLALAVLGWNIWNSGIATGNIDPVRHLGAQDEAVYTREALQMATTGPVLTPVLLDRFVLFKPPLLMWLSALSIELYGPTSLPIRLPALLCGAMICLLAYSMSKSPWAAVLLLLSDRLFHTLARANMTDIVLVFCLTLAFRCFAADTTLRRPGPFYGFAIACGLSILTKSIAGLLPFAVIALFWVLAHKENRPSLPRIAAAAALAAAVMLPWHLYQLIAHYQWFLAEYLGVQLLAFGGKPPQTSQENQIVFYISRLALTDPELMLLFALAIPGLFLAVRKRLDPLAILLTSWLAIFALALLIFQYRSVQYTLPLIPALAIAAATYLPALQRRTTLILLCGAFFVKAQNPNTLWGLTYASGSTLPEAGALKNFCEQKRPNDLIIVEPDDEFLSAVLPLTHVRYAILDPENRNFALEPHLHYLGIIQTADEFATHADPGYAQRLKDWHLSTPNLPLATTVFAKDQLEIQRLIAARPGSDFLLPRTWLIPENLAAHTIVTATRDRVFLTAKDPSIDGTPRPPWGCGL